MSASFHLAQRTGVIISGDYSGEYLPPSGKYGITSRGEVWLNTSPVKVWSAADGWSVPRETSDVGLLKDNNVGYRTAFADAVESARKRAGSAGGGGFVPPSPAASPGVTPPATTTPFYEQGWFLPVAGVTVGAIVLAIVLWPSGKQAPAAA